MSDTLPQGVTLLCVSKYHTVEQIQQAYDFGQRDFAESRLQELTEKCQKLPADIKWHFIGHLQTNKVKALIPLVKLVHSVDSLHLLQTISREAQKLNKNIDVLLQVHIATEEQKFGFTVQQIKMLADNQQMLRQIILPNVKIRGLMGMATNTDDTVQIEQEFETLRQLFNTLKEQFEKIYSLQAIKKLQDCRTCSDSIINLNVVPPANFDILSMGMTGDYTLALKHGTTMVRIGSAIFGDRL